MAVGDTDTISGLRWTLWSLSVAVMILAIVGMLMEWKKWPHWDKLAAATGIYAVMLTLFAVDYDFVVS